MAFLSLMWTPSSRTYIPSRATRFRARCSASDFDFRKYWTSVIEEVDHKLNEAVPLKYPEPIHEAMRYSLSANFAKRGPPVMCVAACELFGGDRATAFPAACALEIVYAASLIHEDMPYIDDVESRRGQPSNHIVYGENITLLAGDALVPLGFHHIVVNTPTHVVPQARLLQVIAEIARAAGSTGMAAAKILDIKGEFDEFEQKNKFGELSQCSVVCGGLLGGASYDEIQQLRKYGRVVGALYRVVEDIMQAKTGTKRKGNDYVLVHGVEKALEMVESLKSVANKELDGFKKYGDKVLPLHGFIDFVIDRGFS